MRLEGQRVMVIGGSSGIGLGTAKAAVREGARVVIASRSAEKLAAAEAEILEVELRGPPGRRPGGRRS